MKAINTYAEIAADFDLWGEYVDAGATMSEEEFDALTIEQKVQMQIDAFGAEPVYLMNPHTGSVDSDSNWAAEGFTTENSELIAVVKNEDGDWVEA